MTIAVIVYLFISCLMVCYFYSDIGWKNNSWKSYVFYLVIFFFWPIVFFISIMYAIIVYLNDYFGPHGGCAV